MYQVINDKEDYRTSPDTLGLLNIVHEIYSSSFISDFLKYNFCLVGFLHLGVRRGEVGREE